MSYLYIFLVPKSGIIVVKKIIISEKPSVGRSYAEALGVNGEKKDGYIEGDDWIVTWAFGHLIAQSYPEKYDASLKSWKGSFSMLPFIPQKWLYEPIKESYKQFKIIKELYNRLDVGEIYLAGDSGREGLYIQELILQEAGCNPSADVKVVWIDSQTKEEILRGVREAKPLSAYDNLKDSGYTRAKEDFLVGINFSRILSVMYGGMLNTASSQTKNKPIAVGRVMTCVLGMIVERGREIDAFKPTPFFKVNNQIVANGQNVVGEWKITEKSSMKDSPKLYSNNGFLSEKDADAFISTLPSSVRVVKNEKKEEKKLAPLLYNLAELQGDCSKKLHISPSETLNIVQSLYEKKLTTYPRTDARVLSTAIQKEIGENLSGLANGEFGGFARHIIESNYTVGGKYVDDSKITDHYAIIPTGITPNGLDGLEAKVYEMITKRFLSVFYPPAIYEKCSLEMVAGNESFFASGKYLKSRGYLEVVGVSEEKEDDSASRESIEAMAQIAVNTTFDTTYAKKKGETKPPKRYTSGSMVLAMENAGKLIEEEELREQIKSQGIGTSATRAATIEKLCKLNYIILDKKTQLLSAAPLGEMVYEVVRATIPSLLSPKMTASWEKGLSQIENGTISGEQYMAIFCKYIIEQSNSMKSNDVSNDLIPRLKPFATGEVVAGGGQKAPLKIMKFACPLCGSQIKKTSSNGYICEKFEKEEGRGCKFYVGFKGVNIPEDDMQKLLNGELIGPYKGFTAKSGKKFEASLSYNKETNRCDFHFANENEKIGEESKFICPDCNKPLIRGEFDFTCDCGMKIPRYLPRVWLSDTDIEKLTKNRKSGLIKGLYSKKTGKTFDAYIKIEGKGIKFEFPPRKGGRR